MKFFKNTFLLTFSATLSVLIVSYLSAGAVDFSIRLEPSVWSVSVGEDFSLKVLVEADKPINVYSISISFDDDKLEVIGINDTGSIADVRRDLPGVFEGGIIRFQGGSLEPFQGKGGLLFVINFTVKQEGGLDFRVNEGNFYLANGKGTKVDPVLSSVRVLALESPNMGDSDFIDTEVDISDTNPPEIKELALVQDPITPEQKLLSFIVRDDVSGVRDTSFEVKRWFWWEGPFSAHNPSSIRKEVWAVRFRAIDNTGNVMQKTVYDWGAFFRYSAPWGLLLVFLISYIAVINRNKSRNCL